MALPVLDFDYTDYDRFYEPSDDTYLLLDALEAEKHFLGDVVKPSICLEIGPGSGAVITALAKTLNAENVYPYMLAVDINVDAAVATRRTAKANNVIVEVVQGDLVGCLKLESAVDVLVFNPPYVPTPSEEVGTRDIAAAWAGGIRGREVVDRLLPKVPQLLSPNGVMYMITVDDNDPKEIMCIMKNKGIHGQIIASRRAKNEALSVIKFTWAG